MGQRLAITRFPIKGLPKNHVFTYDPDTDQGVVQLIAGGYVSDITTLPQNKPPTQVIQMPSIESEEKFGVVGGEGPDQPSEGGGDGDPSEPAAGGKDVQGDEGTGPTVAKGRKRRTDVSTDGRIGF